MLPCFIIAEIGVNHNGDPELAERLIEAAIRAGADAVKFQTWVTEKLVAPDAQMAEYQRLNTGGGTGKNQFDMLKELELSYEEFARLKGYADRQGILFLSTPDEEDSADFLATMNVSAFKIGSGEITNTSFLQHVAKKGRPIILSTGMSTLGEIEIAVRAIEETGNHELVLLHCVSSYPTLPSDCNIRAMDTLLMAFGYPVGFSDHTQGIEVAIAAVARGACVIEKHFTLDKEMFGPDHAASLDPNEFAAMVRAVRNVEKALGDGVKRPVASELETKRVVQKSIVASRRISSGELITEKNTVLLRTSTGLPATCLPSVLGKTALRDIRQYEAIALEMVQ
ncbi:MAG: N,N'-diacetyllegionaminic acid synthase [Syntrophorhabdus sp. PtaU1.Bin002]|nr:MAG: N,N'-diacetyllegionaminic acid synthase [Syntrophorhabdus sp. PtaU1.Bin002]